MSEKSSQHSYVLPGNQKALLEKIERELHEKKMLCAEVTRALENQRREHLEREVKLRQMTAELVEAEVEKRINSDDTKKIIENEAMKLILKKKQRISLENRDGMGKQKYKESNPVDNEERRIKNGLRDQKPSEQNFKQILPLIRGEIRKEMRMHESRGTMEAPGDANNTRGGKFKNVRDQRYRHNFNSGKQQQNNSGQGYSRPPEYKNGRAHFKSFDY